MLEAIAGATGQGVAPGPFAVTGSGGAASDIQSDGVTFFDLGYSFEDEWQKRNLPGVVHLSTWPGVQVVFFDNRMRVHVRFTEDQTPKAFTGYYDFVRDSPGGSIWVDRENALASVPDTAV
jgi:hypothetical protein